MPDLIALKPDLMIEDPPHPPRESRVVLVSGRNIHDVCNASEIPESARVIELRGATLLPGLIDAHVHLSLCGCETPRQTMMQENRDTLLLRAAENARRLLNAGVTTARDCGDRDEVIFALRAAINRGVVPGPRLLLSGAPLTSPRGHCYFMGGEVEGAHHIARAIEERARLGADFIKVMATGGGLTPGTDSLSMQFSPEDLAFIVAEAERHGLYAAAHAHSTESIRASAEAGVRTIEHCSFVKYGQVAADPETVRVMAARQTIAVPTNIPAALALNSGRTLGIATQIGMTPDRFLEGRGIATRQLIAAGVRVIAGTDAGATGVPFDALAREIELLERAYGSALAAIASATSLPADSLGLSRVGRIRKGFAADLVAVSGNPAEANRNAPWWLVGIGTVGATISGITFVSVPGAVGTTGVNKDFSYMQFVFGTMLGYLITAYVLLPVYYRMNLVSIYGYLHNRFGATAQKTGAVFFMVARIVGSSLRLYLLALALQKFVLDSYGVPFWITAIAIPLLIWSYTFRGGTKTVLITDTLQTFLFVTCVVLTLRDLAGQIGGSLGKLFSAIQASHYSQIFFFKAGWEDPNNFFKQFLAGALMTTCTTGLDQDLMQKNLSCRNLHQCRKNLLLSSTSMLVVNYLFLLLGAGLYLFAAACHIAVPAKSDELYPALAFGHLSPSIGLVFMLGLLATTYSTSDSALTSLTTSFCVDILGFEQRAKTSGERALQRIRLAVHFGFTLVFIGMMFVFGAMGNGAVLNMLFQAHGFTYGPILGLFAFGLLTKRRVRDRYIGTLAALAVLLTWWIDSHTGIWFSGLQLGFLRLALNGSIMFAGLCLLAIGARRSTETSISDPSGPSYATRSMAG